jgi:hypothetical protein
MVKEEPGLVGSERAFTVLVKDESTNDSVLDVTEAAESAEEQEDDELAPDDLEDSTSTDNRQESTCAFDISAAECPAAAQINELAKEIWESALSHRKNFQCEGRFHPKTGETCERYFTRQYNLDRHIRKQHMEVTNDGFVQYSPNSEGVLHKEACWGSKLEEKVNVSLIRDVQESRYEAKAMTPEKRSQEYADLMLQMHALNSVALVAPEQPLEKDHPLSSPEEEPSTRKRRRQSGHPSPHYHQSCHLDSLCYDQIRKLQI